MTTEAKAPAMPQSSTQQMERQTYSRRDRHSRHRIKAGRWSVEEVAKLKALEARRLTYKEIGRRLNRSKRCVGSKLAYMGIRRWTSTTRSKRRFELVWSDREKRVVRENYKTCGPTLLAERLGRSASAVRHLGRSLGLARPKNRDWKAADFAVLAQPISIPEMATQLRRTKSAVSRKLWEMRTGGRPTRAYHEYIAASKERSAPKRKGGSKCSVKSISPSRSSRAETAISPA